MYEMQYIVEEEGPKFAYSKVWIAEKQVKMSKMSDLVRPNLKNGKSRLSNRYESVNHEP